jgi:hypothetical protein
MLGTHHRAGRETRRRTRYTGRKRCRALSKSDGTIEETAVPSPHPQIPDIDLIPSQLLLCRQVCSRYEDQRPLRSTPDHMQLVTIAHSPHRLATVDEAVIKTEPTQRKARYGCFGVIFPCETSFLSMGGRACIEASSSCSAACSRSNATTLGVFQICRLSVWRMNE